MLIEALSLIKVQSFTLVVKVRELCNKHHRIQIAADWYLQLLLIVLHQAFLAD